MIEIQQKFSIMRPGDTVLDLGCAPGAWSQVAMKSIGPKGFLVGVDLLEVGLIYPNAKFLVADIYDLDVTQLEGQPFSCLFSDMSPKLSGIRFTDEAKSENLCRQALFLTDSLLKKGGNFVVKTFMGSGQQDFVKDVRKQFKTTKLFRPDSTRKSSAEIYVVGMGKI
jgi:23S rRNA (uridine2552-2'-O)-methyltransferase